MAATITQLSKETGATKQAIRKFCARKHYAKDARGFYVIDDAVEREIRKYFNEVSIIKVSTRNVERESKEVSNVSSQHVSKVARMRIAELESEIDRLTEECKQLRNIVEHEQKANIILLEQIQTLTKERMLIEAPQPTKGVFQRLKDALFGSGE